MSWIYVPESAASPSHSSTLSGDPEQCATSNGTNTASKSSNKESSTATLTTPPYGETCEPSTEHPGVDAWILSLRASRASRSALPVSSGGKQTNETSGRICGERFAKYDCKSCSWRTYQLSLLTNTESEYSGTWPKAGMIVAGVSYRLHHHKNQQVNDCLLWPRPRACSALSARITENADPNRFPNLETVILKRLKREAIGCWVNPRFCEILMGFPNEWADLKHLETQSFQQWLQKHGRC